MFKIKESGRQVVGRGIRNGDTK